MPKTSKSCKKNFFVLPNERWQEKLHVKQSGKRIKNSHKFIWLFVHCYVLRWSLIICSFFIPSHFSFLQKLFSFSHTQTLLFICCWCCASSFFRFHLYLLYKFLRHFFFYFPMLSGNILPASFSSSSLISHLSLSLMLTTISLLYDMWMI